MKVPYFNETKNHVHIGPVTIAPGMTRDVEDSHIPGYKAVEKKVTVAPTASEKLVELLKGNADIVIAALPDMAAADLEQLELLEREGKDRKGVLNAIAEELLNRAAQAELQAKVEAMNDQELADALEDAKTDINVDPDFLSALEAEAGKRNPGDAA